MGVGWGMMMMVYGAFRIRVKIFILFRYVNWADNQLTYHWFYGITAAVQVLSEAGHISKR